MLRQSIELKKGDCLFDVEPELETDSNLLLEVQYSEDKIKASIPPARNCVPTCEMEDTPYETEKNS